MIGVMIMDKQGFLPLSRKEADLRGWGQLDFILVSGDAYVDHPSFGTALIGRLLENEGFSVGIIAQPNWQSLKAIQTFGAPRLAFIVGSGNIDSMVNHYTASKKPRHQDSYSPGGQKGLRPDRAVKVYCDLVKAAYPDSPLIIGGIEASLRRFAHYDYWSDSVMASILLETGADMLTYGMSEKQMVYLAKGLEKGWPLAKMQNVQGTCYLSESLPKKEGYLLLPSYEQVAESRKQFARAFMLQNQEQNPFIGKTLVQPHGDRYLIQLPPALPLNQGEMDQLYQLPFMRTYHPRYENAGGIPALLEVAFSVTDHRGCFGGCTFCAINFHQGRIIQNRSEQSILDEVRIMTKQPDFKGYIHDIGGPTANFRNVACKKQLKTGACKNRQCLFPDICPNLEVDHQDYLAILRKARKVERVKKVFIRSGIRFDYLLADKNQAFFEEMCQHHISGQLKVAPEHVAGETLSYMGKPKRHVYDKFATKYKAINQKVDKDQYLIPYFMSSHPGCTLADAVSLAEYIRDLGYNPEQVQDFIPTPGSMATAMYHTGLDPRTMKPVYVPRDPQEKAWQRALLQYRNPKNYNLVYQALTAAGREDLIGTGAKCLIRPRIEPSGEKSTMNQVKPSETKTNKVKAQGGKKKTTSQSREKPSQKKTKAKGQEGPAKPQKIGAKGKVHPNIKQGLKSNIATDQKPSTRGKKAGRAE